uniref:Uncharacterized protein n=1 Tax=Haptolina ericina TaxID=156174 RepID=A0A7S3FDN9_9EUKA
MGTRERGRPYYFSGDAPPPEATFRSERIESTRLTFGATPATLRGAVEKSFRRAHEAAANSKAQKAFRPETKALMQRLQVLEQAQLAQMICSLVDGGHVADEAVVKLIPSADLDPMLKECEKLVNAIRRALPNSRWGSCTDHFGYKRCASAVNTAKRKLLEGAKQFKGAKQWSTAKEYSERALPIARDMVVFDCVDDNGARNTVISELQKLQQEAEAQMKSVTMVD